MGTSFSSKDGSEVKLKLRQSGKQFAGKWHERTSPAGHYGGREFNGIVLLILSEEGQELSGQWLGVSSSTNLVKNGAWVLRRKAQAR